MTLAELVAQRLERAGITWDDPGLVQLREHNRRALERAHGRPFCDMCPGAAAGYWATGSPAWERCYRLGRCGRDTPDTAKP